MKYMDLEHQKSKLALIPEYEYRLGLSATPKRWYDDYGTKVIYDYFKEEIYEFSIEKALQYYKSFNWEDLPNTLQIYSQICSSYR